MRKHIIGFLSFILLVTLINAQPIITETKLLYPLGTSIVKNIQGGNTTYDYGIYNIGKESSNNIEKIYRTYFNVDLSSIPTNATIQEVKINYSTNYKSYTFKLTNISSLGSTLGASWEAIGKGNTLHSGIGYGSGTITSTSVKNQMQSALSNRSMMIGGVSENETSNDSHSSLFIYLEVKYTRPGNLLNFIAQNYMDGGVSGTIGVGINIPTITERTSPFSFSIYETQTMYFQAYDNQQYNNYNWIFNDTEAPSGKSEWQKDYYNQITNISSQATISRSAMNSENGATFQAVLRKVCNLTFNSPGGVYINGTTYPSPKVVEVVEQNSVTVSGQWYYSNGIEYSFSHWTSDGQSFSNTITANQHKSFNAVYIGKPSNLVEYVHFGTNVNQPIEIKWNDNPNPNVTQYQIWRKVKHNGVVGPERLIGTVGRGVGRYVDYDYVLTSSYTDDLLMYDVRAFYSIEGTYSDPNYVSVYGAESLFKKGGENKPIEYSMEVYPNPFNPSTTISYQLPERSIVTIKIYDMLGREVKELIEEIKEAGYYKLEFNGNELSSGIYICTIRANKFSKSIKLMLIK